MERSSCVLSDKAAADELRAEVRAGRLAADVVDVVLDAAGRAYGRRRGGPAGLTAREVEVLVLLARGASNKQVAQVLGIAPKTAGTRSSTSRRRVRRRRQTN